jgi:serine/threonine protein kinase/tetratricopeptide (TPR) repeat protein
MKETTMESELRITIEDIFQTVCDLPREQRSIYLDEACAGDDKLRREVEALLKYYDTNNSFLENRALDDAARQFITQPSAPPVAPSMIGRQIENYRVLALLGAGGMGEVYLAHDANLDIDVAIKFLPAAYADDPEWQARFNREGRLNAAVKHPNIAAILHKGQADNRPFLVFEYVAGETLEQRLDRGPLNFKEALPLFRDLAAALECAHQNGIIHRDLKPANIKITPEGQLKVLDFGIAKKVTTDLTTVDLATLAPDDELTRDFGETRKGEVIGTVVYMSPEQTRGESLDRRTDIWSFGCVLYEALTGQLPFKGIDTYDTLQLIRSPEQQPDWRALPHKTPRAVRRLLRDCLAKDFRHRLSTAAQAQEVMDKALTDLELGFFSFWPRQRKQQLAFVTTMAVLLLAAFLAGRWTWAWLNDPLPKEKYLAVLPFKDVDAPQPKGRLGSGLAKSLHDIFTRVPELKLISQSSIVKTYAELGLTEPEPQRILHALGTNLLLGGEIKRAGNRVEINYWLVNARLKEIKRDSISGDSDELPALRVEMARRVIKAMRIPEREVRPTDAFNNPQHEREYQQTIAVLQGDLDAPTVEQVIATARALLVGDGPARVQALLAQAYFRHFTITQRRESLDEALKAGEKALQLDPNVTDIEVQVTHGLVLTALNKHQDAISAFTAALNKQPNHSEALLGLAAAYEYIEPAAEDKTDYRRLAEETYQRAIRLWPQYWSVYNELGSFYFSQGRYDEAKQAWQRVLDLVPDSPSGLVNSANVSFKLGELDRARNAYQQLLNRDPNSVEGLAGLGTAQFYLRDFSQAAASFKRATEVNPDAPTPWGNLGDAYRQMVSFEQEAVNAYDKAIELTVKDLSGNRDNTAEISRLAEYYAKRSTAQKNDKGKAQADARRAQDLIERAIKTEITDSEIPSSAILVYHLLGLEEQAVQWVEKALQQGLEARDLQINPELDALRTNPNVQRMISNHQPQ